MTPDRHFVSVVIPTSGRRTLEDVQQALMHQSRRPDEICVIVDKERRGPAWGRNRGIEKSQGDNRGVGIALLHKAVRGYGHGMLPQQSVLWDPERTGAERLLGLLKAKIIGPVNASSFPHKRYYLIHWIAEKAQSIGYLWGVLRYGR